MTAIVPSCYDNEREKVALLEFRGGFPNFLSELKANPLGDWQVEMGDTDITLTGISLASPSCMQRSHESRLLQSKWHLCTVKPATRY
jgi:hypothetical protein